MKKFYALALSAAVSLTAAAAPAVNGVATMRGAKTHTAITKNERADRSQRHAMRNTFNNQSSNLVNRPLVGVTYDENGLVKPMGAESSYSSTGFGVNYSLWGTILENFDMYAPVYLDNANKKVYLGKMIPNSKGYLVGDIDTNTGEVVIQLPQAIGYYDMRELGDMFDYSILTYASLGEKYEYTEDGETYVDFAPVTDPEKNVIRFKLEGRNWVGEFDYTGEAVEIDGTTQYDMPAICLTSFDEYSDEPDELYCTFNQTWTSKYVPFNEKPVSIPGSVKMDYNWLLNSVDGTPMYVGIGSDGDDVYLAGLNSQFDKNCVLKGTREGDTFTFPNQYVGYNEEYEVYMYMVAGTVKAYEEEGALLYATNPFNDAGEPYGKFVFNYDSEKFVFTAADPDIAIAFVDDTEEPLITYAQYQKPVINYVNADEFAAPVVDPVYIGLEDWLDTDGSVGFHWTVTPENTNGVLLDYKKMWVNIYVNGAIHKFYDDDYQLGSDLTDLPLTVQAFNAFYDHNMDELIVFIFSEGIETIGIKVYNPVGEDVYSSNLVTTDIASLAEAFLQGKEVQGVTYFDLQGRRLERPAGVCVARTVFTDGTSAASKVVVR